MLKKSASGVLAALPTAVKRETRVNREAAALLGARRVSARQGWAGEKSSLFEHPAWCTPAIPDLQTSEIPAYPQIFSAACYTLSQDSKKVVLHPPPPCPSRANWNHFGSDTGRATNVALASLELRPRRAQQRPATVRAESKALVGLPRRLPRVTSHGGENPTIRL